MSDIEVLPEIERIVGALLFAAKQPVTLDQIKGVFNRVAENEGGVAADYAGVKKARVREAVEEVSKRIGKECPGFNVVEVAGGYRLENEVECGPWVRELLEKSKPRTLSIPALETLAIVAYRQPCTRAQVEEIRGVAVDQILRNLLQMQLVKITGRSDLPGKPWLFGTTRKFLEHFGLNNLEELPSHKDLRRFEKEQEEARKSDAAEGGDAGETEEGETGKGNAEQKVLTPDLSETIEEEQKNES